MPPVSSTSKVRLIAVALADETTWWLGEPRSSRIFSEEPTWSSCLCYWLYPVDTSPESFADVPGFEPTSSIYELVSDGTSRVLHSAALADDVEAIKVTINRVSYVFVPQDQVKRLDLIYSAMLRREAAGIPPAVDREDATASPKADEAEDDDDDGEYELARSTKVKRHARKTNRSENVIGDSAKPTADDDHAVGRTGSDATDLALLGIPQSDSFLQKRAVSGAVNRESSLVSSASWETASSTRGRNHQRVQPLAGTTVIVAPHLAAPQGEHASNEAFAWPKHFIAHVGSADYLCPSADNNRYGFRLDKVTNMGFPVFLLYGSAANSSYSFSPPVNGVPVHESTILNGQSTDRAGGDRRVLICTRLASRRSTHGNASASQTQRQPVQQSRLGGDHPGYEEDADEDADDDYASRKPRRVYAAESNKSSNAHRRHREPPSASSSQSHSRKTARHERASEPAQNPLTAVSVNLWSEPQVAIPPVAELARRYPLSTDGGVSGMQTCVFADGTCVTYSASTAAKLAQQDTTTLTKKGSSWGGGSSSSALDDDMRGLLENIELARMQSNASGAS